VSTRPLAELLLAFAQPECIVHPMATKAKAPAKPGLENRLI
jgi:hypothetical protein